MMNRKKSNLHTIAFTSILLITLFIYSCSTDEYEYPNKPKKERNGLDKSCALSLDMKTFENALIDSVAVSDEFWEFKISSQLLAEKFGAYTSTLSEKEYDKLMSNLNNDDYMEEFIKKANLEKELQQMDNANKGLFQHTAFLRLSEDEQSQLFMLSTGSTELTKPALLKTRREGGGTNECEKQKQVAYAQAESDYNKAVTKCKNTSSSYICYTQASSVYSRDLRYADREYEECTQNNK